MQQSRGTGQQAVHRMNERKTRTGCFCVSRDIIKQTLITSGFPDAMVAFFGVDRRDGLFLFPW